MKLMKIATYLLIPALAGMLGNCSQPDAVKNNSADSPQLIAESYKKFGEVNHSLSDKGKEIFNTKCISCHQMEKRVVGPPLKDITTRRTAEWLQEMIVNPKEMVKNDPVAKQLLQEYNNMPMIVPGGVSNEEARAIIEYLRGEKLIAGTLSQISPLKDEVRIPSDK